MEVAYPSICCEPQDFEFTLRNGMVAIVDAEQRAMVEKSQWSWMRGRGVASYTRDQTILLHNMISPYFRVSFINGDKLDCRRSNLVRWGGPRGAMPRAQPQGLIYHDVKARRFQIRRKVSEGGEVFVWSTSRNYGSAASRTVALASAGKVAEWLRNLPREDFIDLVKGARSKRTTYEIITEWDAHKGRAWTRREFAQMGVTTPRNDIN